MQHIFINSKSLKSQTVITILRSSNLLLKKMQILTFQKLEPIHFHHTNHPLSYQSICHTVVFIQQCDMTWILPQFSFHCTTHVQSSKLHITYSVTGSSWWPRWTAAFPCHSSGDSWLLLSAGRPSDAPGPPSQSPGPLYWGVKTTTQGHTLQHHLQSWILNTTATFVSVYEVTIESL